MDTKRCYRPKRRKKLDGKRCIDLNGNHCDDFLGQLKEKLEDEHIKRYTFIVKGSKLYTQGIFWSEKNQRKYVFRSTYEFGYFYMLENDPNVTAYIVEPFDIPYLDPRYKYERRYKPDVLVHYRNGNISLLEIKPKRKLRAKDVRAKAEGARNFLKLYYPSIKYNFVTEEEIFNNPSDYNKLLGKLDPAKAAKREVKRAKRAEKHKFVLSKPGDFSDRDYIRSKLPKQFKNSAFHLM